jgi:hypothetical protein
MSPHRLRAVEKKGRAGTMTHDYKRHGATTLFAAMNILDGTAIGFSMQRCADEPPRARRIEVLSQGSFGTVTASPPTTIFLCGGCQIPPFSDRQGS